MTSGCSATSTKKILHADVGGLESVRESVSVHGQVEEIVRAVFGDLTSDGGVKCFHQLDTQVVCGSCFALLFNISLAVAFSPGFFLIFAYSNRIPSLPQTAR